MLILAPVVGTLLFVYAFAARSLFGAIRIMAMIGLTSGGIILFGTLAA